MAYPENIPPDAKVTMDTFNFSFTLAKKVKEEFEQEHSVLSERIENIIESEKFFISGIPVLKSILALNPSKNDLKKLAKATSRLSELIEQHTLIENKLNLIKTVNDNPHWFAWTFGDFSKEVDQDIDSLFKEIED